MGQVEEPAYLEFQGYMQAAHVNCGPSRLCSGRGGVYDPLGEASLSYSAFVGPHQRGRGGFDVGG